MSWLDSQARQFPGPTLCIAVPVISPFQFTRNRACSVEESETTLPSGMVVGVIPAQLITHGPHPIALMHRPAPFTASRWYS